MAHAFIPPARHQRRSAVPARLPTGLAVVVVMTVALALASAPAAATTPSSSAAPQTGRAATKSKRRTPRKRHARRSHRRSKTVKPGAQRAAAGSTSPCQMRGALAAVRAEMAVAAKAGRPSELASLLMSATLENAFTQSLHSHYALMGLGKALHKGAMERPVVAAMASDMARNLAGNQRTFAALAQQKALGQLRQLFRSLAELSVAGTAAARALADWAGKPSGSALAFDQAAEKYRAGVEAFAKAASAGAGAAAK